MFPGLDCIMLRYFYHYRDFSLNLYAMVLYVYRMLSRKNEGQKAICGLVSSLEVRLREGDRNRCEVFRFRLGADLEVLGRAE
jgi:hypothetical protein